MRHVKAWRTRYELVAVGIRTCGGRDTNVWQSGYERVADGIRTCGGRDTKTWRTQNADHGADQKNNSHDLHDLFVGE